MFRAYVKSGSACDILITRNQQIPSLRIFLPYRSHEMCQRSIALFMFSNIFLARNENPAESTAYFASRRNTKTYFTLKSHPQMTQLIQGQAYPELLDSFNIPWSTTSRSKYKIFMSIFFQSNFYLIRFNMQFLFKSSMHKLPAPGKICLPFLFFYFIEYW